MIAAPQIVREILAKTGITQVQLTKLMGLKTPSVLSGRLFRQDMKLETFVETINACGYTIEIKNPSGEVEYSFKPEVSSDEKDC